MTGLSPEMRGVRAIEKEPNTASEGRSADAAVDGAQIILVAMSFS